ncbi:MAG: hypothetical protein PQ975_01640 [Methanobacterium sp.]|jgi:hypothetical protein
MKVSLAKEEVSIVKESLQRELILSKSKVNLLKEEIKGFEKKYGMSSEEFMEKFEQGELGDDQNYFEWWGLLRGIKKIEEKIGKIKAVLSY